MSSITEYLKLLPLAWKNRDKIVEGVITKVKQNIGTLPEDEEQEIIRRNIICTICPFMSTNAKKEGYKTDRLDDFCTLCNCSLILKTSSLSSDCGASIWNEDNPDDQIPLRWHAYKTT